MMTSNESLTPRSRNNLFAALFLAIALVGFADAAYLTIKHYAGGPIPCAVFTGCETVTASTYSTVFGVPVALLGALYYLSMFVLAIAYFDTKKEFFLRMASMGSAIGILATLWFLYVQAVLLGAFCFYCIVSAGTSISLFVAGITYLTMHFRRGNIKNNTNIENIGG